MAIKIRCSECSKKVSIDEAFAGGMCRCPYCKALVYVPEAEGKAGPAARPEAPGARPEAPEAELAPAAAPGGEAVSEEHIPMARPVKIQGVITLILLALLAIMVAAGIFLALKLIPSGPGDRDIPDENPPIGPLVKIEGPSVAGIKLTVEPVMYVVDAGSSMQATFDMARKVVAQSIESLGSSRKFTVLLSGEESDKPLGAEFIDGGAKGRTTFEQSVASLAPAGASDLPRALKAALDRKPKIIVLIARKPVHDAMELAAQAKQQSVPIITISLNGDPEANESMKKLSETSGGEFREFYNADL